MAKQQKNFMKHIAILNSICYTVKKHKISVSESFFDSVAVSVRPICFYF